MSPPANGLHEPASLCTASIVYCVRHTAYGADQTNDALRIEAPAGCQLHCNECAGARWSKLQGGVGLSRHWTGLVCAIPPQFPPPAEERLSPLHHAHLPCSMWALGHSGTQSPLCDLIYVSK